MLYIQMSEMFLTKCFKKLIFIMNPEGKFPRGGVPGRHLKCAKDDHRERALPDVS